MPDPLYSQLLVADDDPSTREFLRGALTAMGFVVTLAEDGAHRELETVPGAGRAQAGAALDQRRERAVAGEMRADGRDVGVVDGPEEV